MPSRSWDRFHRGLATVLMYAFAALILHGLVQAASLLLAVIVLSLVMATAAVRAAWHAGQAAAYRDLADKLAADPAVMMRTPLRPAQPGDESIGSLLSRQLKRDP